MNLGPEPTTTRAAGAGTRQRFPRLSRRLVAPSSCPFPRAAVPPAKHSLPLLPGKCRGKTRIGRKRNTIGTPAQRFHPPQGLGRNGVSDPHCTPGARGPKTGPCGSAPTEKNPYSCKRALRRGRSRDSSLQEGGRVPRAAEEFAASVQTVMRRPLDSRGASRFWLKRFLRARPDALVDQIQHQRKFRSAESSEQQAVSFEPVLDLSRHRTRARVRRLNDPALEVHICGKSSTQHLVDSQSRSLLGYIVQVEIRRSMLASSQAYLLPVG